MPQDKTLPDREWDSIEIDGRIPTDGFLGSRLEIVSTRGELYVDNPAVELASGAASRSFVLGQCLGLADDDRFESMKLRKIRLRCEFPTSGAEELLVRFWRYHKDDPNTGFFYQQISDPYTLDASFPWSWTVDISDIIRPIVLDTRFDALAITGHYTPGTGPSLRAVSVEWDLEPVDPDSGDPLFEDVDCHTSSAYPPG